MGFAADYGYIEQIEAGNSSAKVFVDKINGRLRVVEYAGPAKALPGAILTLAKATGAGKIIFFVPAKEKFVLEEQGYVLEGEIPGFFNGATGYGYSLYVRPDRARSLYIDREDQMLRSIMKKERDANGKRCPASSDMTIRPAAEADIPGLISMYREIFASYPSPLMQPEYMRQAMRSNTLFMGAFFGGRPVSAASLETDRANANAELTDCATLPGFRGKGILQELISRLEKEGRKMGLGVIYSLARAGSFGMNVSLYKLGYDYKGRFINNCHIDGRFEDMNLWVKCS